MEARFCSTCGAGLQLREIEGKKRAFCPACDQIHYEQPKVGAGALIELDERLLLLQRTSEPFRLYWNLPAGYVEVDETPAQAAVREAREETGLQVEIVALENVYSYTDDPRGNGVFVVYRCHVIGGALSESPEGINPTYVARDQIPDRLAGGGHDQAILAWQQQAGSIPVR